MRSYKDRVCRLDFEYITRKKVVVEIQFIRRRLVLRPEIQPERPSDQ